MATQQYDRPGRPGNEFGTRPSMVRWGAILAGSVIGVGLLLLFSSLWVAWGQDVDAIADNIEWYTMVTAVVSLFIAGLLAGWLSGVRGWGPGLAHGFTVWGLVLTVSLVIGAPQAIETLDTTAAVEEFTEDAPLWSTFLGLLIGLGAAIIGGALGGGMPRPASFFETMGDDDGYTRHRDADVDVRESPVVEGTARSHVEQRQSQAQPQTTGSRGPQGPQARRR